MSVQVQSSQKALTWYVQIVTHIWLLNRMQYCHFKHTSIWGNTQKAPCTVVPNYHFHFQMIFACFSWSYLFMYSSVGRSKFTDGAYWLNWWSRWRCIYLVSNKWSRQLGQLVWWWTKWCGCRELCIHTVNISVWLRVGRYRMWYCLWILSHPGIVRTHSIVVNGWHTTM